MLKLYYAPASAYARPVWLALLEKQLPFELIPIRLDGEQFRPEFLALNPFSHVPVLIDGDLRIIESLAILDYLEVQYPDPPLLPSDPVDLAHVRMVQLIAVNELLPALINGLIHLSTGDQSSEVEYCQGRMMKVLAFLEDLLGGSPYFAGEQLTLAEIVAGTLVGRVTDLGIDLAQYPNLKGWMARLLQRPTWQQIDLAPEEWQRFRRFIKVLPKLWNRRRRQQIQLLSQGSRGRD